MSDNQKQYYRSQWDITFLNERLGLLARRVLRRWQIGRTMAVLESLDDDLLRDIGITRGEIPATALRVTAPARPSEAGRRSTARPLSGKEVTT